MHTLESQERRYLAEPLPLATVSRLVRRGPRQLLPFTTTSSTRLVLREPRMTFAASAVHRGGLCLTIFCPQLKHSPQKHDNPITLALQWS